MAQPPVFTPRRAPPPPIRNVEPTRPLPTQQSKPPEDDSEVDEDDLSAGLAGEIDAIPEDEKLEFDEEPELPPPPAATSVVPASSLMSGRTLEIKGMSAPAPVVRDEPDAPVEHLSPEVLAEHEAGKKALHHAVLRTRHEHLAGQALIKRHEARAVRPAPEPESEALKPNPDFVNKHDRRFGDDFLAKRS